MERKIEWEWVTQQDVSFSPIQKIIIDNPKDRHRQSKRSSSTTQKIIIEDLHRYTNDPLRAQNFEHTEYNFRGKVVSDRNT